MSTRFKTALALQAGACNARAISNTLTNAIDECRNEGGSEREDPAVFLILHQLAFILTGHDFSCSDARMAARWAEATKGCELIVEKVAP